MKITMDKKGTELTVALEGRLDTMTSPELEQELEKAIGGIKKLIFDFAELEYISSAGLRVMLTAMQTMEDQGELVVRNVSPEIMDIFEVTGFADDLSFE